MEMDKVHSKIQHMLPRSALLHTKGPVTSNHHNFPHALDLQETHRTPAQGLNIQLIAMPRSDSQGATQEWRAQNINKIHKHTNTQLSIFTILDALTCFQQTC
jgi:hypothetical protein